MQLISTMGRIMLASLLVVLISACSSTSYEEKSKIFAAERAAMLSRIVPVDMNGYNLVRVKAEGSNIELTLLYTGGIDVVPIVLVKNIKKTYCSDTEVVSLMEKGVGYKLIFRDMRGRPVLENLISYQDCE
ncbi:type II secretion system pilot lipoprotein GspS-beta [Candidatus Enterovibrio escicola]|uniref:Uncharacterized protein n=2 Tax=Candidatus Enterovibrio escicola TaxID=1927127 RepID=A0A2A5T113_9GAMM|nr:type II secretion system pilot lipoprotein GspS-beta [Candidatus Enterovibrio escacola]PCS21859.1 hypothetical protein BTN49_2545 [Candidatus Enterovibrio escacola]